MNGSHVCAYVCVACGCAGILLGYRRSNTYNNNDNGNKVKLIYFPSILFCHITTPIASAIACTYTWCAVVAQRRNRYPRRHNYLMRFACRRTFVSACESASLKHTRTKRDNPFAMGHNQWNSIPSYSVCFIELTTKKITSIHTRHHMWM